MTQLRQARGHSRHHLRVSDLPPIAVSVRKSWVVCEFASEERTDECAHGTKVTFIACLDRFAGFPFFLVTRLGSGLHPTSHDQPSLHRGDEKRHDSIATGPRTLAPSSPSQ